jgi:lipoic acid synthetase
MTSNPPSGEAGASALPAAAAPQGGHPGLRDKKRGALKTRILLKSEPATPAQRKPDWIRVKIAPDSSRFQRVKSILREQNLHTVCEEASCPNIGECFGHGTATFMIMGDKCTRRCPFCDVGHGYPDPLDEQEPSRLAQTIAALGLKHVVITSVDRDDLKDGGAGHFARCIRATREQSPGTRIEVLVPDFRGRMEVALQILAAEPPDILNHNLETVPRLYKTARPGANYQHSLALLREFKARVPGVPTKSGLMLGLGESDDEILAVMRDLRAHDVDMLTIGQYLAPSGHHLPVLRYVEPAAFEEFGRAAREMGFSHAASAPLVRSSYHADLQAQGVA